MTVEKRSLHTKLAQVMYEAERIPKNGIGPREQGSYPFVQVGDAADFIRKALAEKVVTMMPTHVQITGQSDRLTEKGKTMTTVDLIVDWTLTDGESGESIVIQSFGAGSDTGDKYSGKASTSAMKYAFLTGFLLSTGDDVENQDTSDRQFNPPNRSGGLVDGPPNRPQLVRETGNDGLVGKVATSGTQDMNLRETPDGLVLPFRVKEGNRAGQIVIAHDAVAEALFAIRDTVIGQTVTVWGRYEDLESPPKPDGFVVTYKVLHLTRIKTPDVIIPPDEAETAALFPDDDLSDMAGYS